MITYITAFIFYTLAMIGVLIGGFIVYKKAFAPVKNENKGMIKILDSYTIAPKKTLMVVRIKSERFLIALDSERTTFLSKLADENQTKKETQKISEDNSNYEYDIEQEIQNALSDRTVRYDDIRKSKVDEAQKQFMELYSKDEPKVQSNQNQEFSQRKKMIRHLISELNSNKTQTGSKF